MKSTIIAGIGIAGGFLSSVFGGFDGVFSTLLIFMTLDYITGLIVAGVFHKSLKTESGTLESRAGWKGLCRKGATLLIVLIAHRLDLAMNINFARDSVIIGYTVNEAVSIVENVGLMGIPIPDVIKKAIDVLKKKEGEKSGNY